MSNNQAIEHMRRTLGAMYAEGYFDVHPSLKETVHTGLMADAEMLADVYGYVMVQDLHSPSEPEPEQPEPLFREPAPEQLHGEIFIGRSIPSGYDVHLPFKLFGGRSQIGVYGAAGTGKSVLLHMISIQLIQRQIPTFVFDTLDQAAPLIVPHVQPDLLSVIDFQDYRRNFLMGPKGMPQLDYIKSASSHLEESLDISPVTIHFLEKLCERIVRQGQIASVPKVIALTEQDRSQSARALLNRLYRLVIADQVFTCDRGFDLEKLFTRSCILNIKRASKRVRRLIYNDFYFYLTCIQEALPDWKFLRSFVYHEAALLLNHPSEFFQDMIAQARNYGIGLIFANQAPQLQHDIATSNIGTKLLFRLEDPSSLEGFKTGMNLSEEQRNFILNMPDRVMLLKRPDIHYPFLVRVPDLFQ